MCLVLCSRGEREQLQAQDLALLLHPRLVRCLADACRRIGRTACVCLVICSGPMLWRVGAAAVAETGAAAAQQAGAPPCRHWQTCQPELPCTHLQTRHVDQRQSCCVGHLLRVESRSSCRHRDPRCCCTASWCAPLQTLADMPARAASHTLADMPHRPEADLLRWSPAQGGELQQQPALPPPCTRARQRPASVPQSGCTAAHMEPRYVCDVQRLFLPCLVSAMLVLPSPALKKLSVVFFAFVPA